MTNYLYPEYARQVTRQDTEERENGDVIRNGSSLQSSLSAQSQRNVWNHHRGHENEVRVLKEVDHLLERDLTKRGI